MALRSFSFSLSAASSLEMSSVSKQDFVPSSSRHAHRLRRPLVAASCSAFAPRHLPLPSSQMTLASFGISQISMWILFIKWALSLIAGTPAAVARRTGWPLKATGPPLLIICGDILQCWRHGPIWLRRPVHLDQFDASVCCDAGG